MYLKTAVLLVVVCGCGWVDAQDGEFYCEWLCTRKLTVSLPVASYMHWVIITIEIAGVGRGIGWSCGGVCGGSVGYSVHSAQQEPSVGSKECPGSVPGAGLCDSHQYPATREVSCAPHECMCVFSIVFSEMS